MNPYLVKSTAIDYDDFDYTQPYTPAAEAAHAGSTRTRSVMRSITQSGYVHAPTTAEPLRYLKQSFPPLEFEYTRAIIDETVRDADGVETRPMGNKHVRASAEHFLTAFHQFECSAMVQGAWYSARVLLAQAVTVRSATGRSSDPARNRRTTMRRLQRVARTFDESRRITHRLPEGASADGSEVGA